MKNEIPLQQTIRSIYWIRWNFSLSVREIEFLYGLDDEYELAACHSQGTLEQVNLKTISFLEIYKDLTFENFRRWEEINSAIENEIINI